MSLAVTRKPPLPSPQVKPVDPLDELADAVTPSASTAGKKLRTSQRETISDGTIFGLKDIFYQNEPDLTYYCSQCARFISLLSLKDHKAYHNALIMLELSFLPSSLKQLIQKRNQILKKVKEDAAREDNSLDIKVVQQIDEAYELIKQEMEDTFESCRKVDEKIDFKVESFDLSCEVECVSAVGHCSERNSRWKSKMEDCKVYQDCYGNDPSKAFVALYDGYNGRYASAVAANELHYLLLRELSKFDPKVTCKCTFNMMEENDISQFDLIRPPVVPCGHTRLVHQKSSNYVQQVIYTCETQDAEGDNHLSSHHPIKCKPSQEEMEPPATPGSGRSVKDEYSQRMKAAFRQAYKLTDRVLQYGGDEKSRVRWSGCSTVTVVLEDVNSEELASSREKDATITDASAGKDADKEDNSKNYEQPKAVGRLHIANAGNCHAVLVRDNRTYLLTKSHTHENSKERHRIINAGGSFSQSEKEMRVNGISLTTRGLGNHGDPVLKSLISWEPYCTTVPLDQYSQLLILATHGVWQVFSPQEAAELLLQVLPQNRMPTPGYISPSVDQLKRVEEEVEHKVHSPDDEFAEETIPLPADEAAVERKSSLSAKPASARKSRGPVTFQDGVEGEERKQEVEDVGQKVLLEEDEMEEEELREIRSEDSGNEADVDTDWASTLPPNEVNVRSALSGQSSLQRYLSKLLSERLVQSALLAGAKDNISAVVIVLPGTRVANLV